MEFLFEDMVPEPQESDLRAFYDAHHAMFRAEPLISFRQVFLSSRRGGTAEADSEQVLIRLAAGADVNKEGDASPLSEGFDHTQLSRVAALLGDTFWHQLVEVAGRWVGPLNSAYGFHLVQVTAIGKATSVLWRGARRRPARVVW